MVKVFHQIGELVTMSSAAHKDGRRILDEDITVIKDGALVAEGPRILWVGEKKKLKSALRDLKVKKSKEIPLFAKTVMPAFVECHTHLIFAGDRKNEFEWRNEGRSYAEIARSGGGIQSTVAKTAEASPKALLKLAEKRVQEFIRQGVTTLEIKSGYGLNEKDEIKILKVAQQLSQIRKVVTYLGPHACPKGRSTDDYLNEIMTSTLSKIKKASLADRVDMFVEDGYFNLTQAKKYYSLAKKLGFRITAHADQLTRTGAGDALASLGAESVDHLIEITASDIQNLSRSQSTCVLLPTSDFYLKMKYPPARDLIDSGARVALATDFNPGTSPTQDLSFVGVLARLHMKMKLGEVLAAYTIGAAHALGLQKDLGSLEKGKYCDFVVLSDSWRDLFYQVGSHPVQRVFSKSVEMAIS